jgi:hypothetical protein
VNIMNIEKSHDNLLTNNRFRTLIILIRLAGVPLNMQSISKLHAVYNIFVTVCFYITNLSIFLDFIFNGENLKEAMKKIRVLFSVEIVIWMHLFLR